MSLKLCPECGTKISDKATKCPYCGFQSADPNRPISEQDSYEIIPIFEYDIEEWNPNRGDLSIISYEDNKTFVSFFGKWENIKINLPAIAEVIESLANKEHVLVAKMDQYVKKLIDTGVFRFTVDKNGEILPTLRDSTGFIKQFRLKEISLSPNITQSLNNLSTHAVMARIIDEIEYVGDALREIHIELQNDRLALTESAKDKLKQARKIQDTKLREHSLLNVISSATDAKRTLMRNFAQNRRFILDRSQKSNFELFLDFRGQKEVDKKAIDAFQALVFLTNAVQIECEGYAMLGEYESCRECLNEFKSFILDNELNERDTLLLLNESLSQKKIQIVDSFINIANNITTFDMRSYPIEDHMQELLSTSNEEDNNNE